MLVQLFRGGLLGRYFSGTFADLVQHITWLDRYLGFTLTVGRITDADGKELESEDVININSSVSLYPAIPFKLLKGFADIVPSTEITKAGVLTYRWRLTPVKTGDDEVHLILKVKSKCKAGDLLGKDLADVYVLEAQN